MSVDVSLKIKKADVLRLGTRVGVGRKVVVVEKEVDTRNKSVRVEYLNLIDHGRLLSEARGWTTFRTDEQVQKLGAWSGNLWSGSRGTIQYNPGLEPGEGEAEMATTKSKSKGKSSTKSKAANKSKSNGGERSRATNEELDELAEQVVDLRDNEGLSWGEIEDQLEVAPSRLRSLYNRGGGEPTRKRQGAAAAKEKADTKKAGKKGGKKRARKEDPSDED